MICQFVELDLFKSQDIKIYKITATIIDLGCALNLCILIYNTLWGNNFGYKIILILAIISKEGPQSFLWDLAVPQERQSARNALCPSFQTVAVSIYPPDQPKWESPQGYNSRSRWKRKKRNPYFFWQSVFVAVVFFYVLAMDFKTLTNMELTTPRDIIIVAHTMKKK